MCQNIAQPVTAREAKPTNLTKITNIDGKVPRRWLSSRSEYNSGSGGQKGRKFDSFQDPHTKMGKENAKWVPFKTPFQDPYICIMRKA